MLGRVFQEAPFDQVGNAFFRLFVKDIETRPVVPLSNHFVEGCSTVIVVVFVDLVVWQGRDDCGYRALI